MKQNELGTLYVVATPIGNLQDITFRAIETLKKVELIVAEDTRHAKPLLNHYSINKPIFSMHEHNERERLQVVLQQLQEGKSIALISDAGTPLISDPGFPLVRAARSEHIPIVPIPGPCAAIAALSVAGLPTDRFVFEGYLPAKEEARCNRLNTLLHEERTIIFYEAPHRIASVLQNMMQIFGPDRKIAIAREMTKIHETITMGTLATVNELVKTDKNAERGEFVILVAGSNEALRPTKEVVPQEVLATLLEVMPLKQAAILTSKITGERKNTLYDMALADKKGKDF